MTAGNAPIYVLRDVRKVRSSPSGDFELHVPQLTIRRGEILILRGTSGSGKSTLLDLLAMTLRPDRANRFEFRPNGKRPLDVRGLWAKDDANGLASLRATNMGYVLQTGGLLPFLTVRDNIALSCRLLGRSVPRSLDTLAKRLGIARRLDALPAKLSVGERQRAAIARAVIHQPSVVLADEPTASVDPIAADAIFKIFLDLVQSLGVTALIASHDWRRIEKSGLGVLQHRVEQAGTVTRSMFWN